MYFANILIGCFFIANFKIYFKSDFSYFWVFPENIIDTMILPVSTADLWPVEHLGPTQSCVCVPVLTGHDSQCDGDGGGEAEVLHAAEVNTSVLWHHPGDQQAVVPLHELRVGAVSTIDALLCPAGAPVLEPAPLLSPHSSEGNTEPRQWREKKCIWHQTT